ncbi:TPA: hypothetical protein HA317_03370 [Candidatus Woesearchaeota archaeon]|nr:hypothetical protein [Candidatus Woesearchaeota archaeon]
MSKCNYDLELPRVVSEIKKRKAKLVLVQLPSGLKPHAIDIQHEIESKTKARVILWAGSCFGACDIPSVDGLGIDLIIQFGHSEMEYKLG